MALYFWKNNDHFKKLPPAKIITSLGKRRWDTAIQTENPVPPETKNGTIIFTMPSFARHGRWGNIVFQYIFLRILTLNNNGKAELHTLGENTKNKMKLYDDMINMAGTQRIADVVLLDSYHIFPPSPSYIPYHFWRALFITNIRRQKCLVLKNVDEAINKKLFTPNETAVEVEGLFMVNPKFYKPHKEFILNNLFKPDVKFDRLIQSCVQNLGAKKTIVGIHIRRGDYIQKPLRQFSQIPVPAKYIIAWLTLNIPLLKNPVIYVCSDDDNAYKEIEQAGFEVFYSKKIIPDGETDIAYEQLDWGLLRQCNVLLTSNSSFSFTSAFLSTKNPVCYKFSFTQKQFVSFDPWESEPLQSCTYSPYVWSYLYARFSLVRNMVNVRSAFVRLGKDMLTWIYWKLSKVFCLYYFYGISMRFFLKLFNLLELFQISNKDTNYLEHTEINNL